MKMKQVKQWFTQNVLLALANKQDTEALKSFAISMSIAFPVIFMLLLPWIFDGKIPLWPALLSMLLMILHVLKPSLLYYPYIMWMLIASVLGYINTRIILALAYYCLIVPIGLFMQWRNGLQYKQPPGTESAWQKRENIPTKQNLKDPF